MTSFGLNCTRSAAISLVRINILFEINFKLLSVQLNDKFITSDKEFKSQIDCTGGYASEISTGSNSLLIKKVGKLNS